MQADFLTRAATANAEQKEHRPLKTGLPFQFNVGPESFYRAVIRVTLFRLTEKGVRIATFADDLLVICAAHFLLSTYLIFWALQSRSLQRTRLLMKLVNWVFLVALTGLVSVGFMMVYTLF